MAEIGRYQILEKLGAGGMGVVYRAFDRALQRQVALKTLKLEPKVDEELQARFMQEAALIGSLSHKNIITVYDLGLSERFVYIAMEFLAGEDLKVKLERREPMPLEEKVRILYEVSDGLACAHRRGIIHRDIKPSNIFICRTGEIKILDFGLARFGTSTLTPVGRILGTPHYMSPEQLRGVSSDHRSDIFSLGALAYELLTFRKAFSAPTVEETLHQIVKRSPKPVEHIEPTVPVELCRIVRKCLAKEPHIRYRDMDSLLQEIDGFRRHLVERKRRLCEEVKQKVKDLESFYQRSQQPGSGVVRLSGLTAAIERKVLSYQTLMGLRDGASLELRRASSPVRSPRLELHRALGRESSRERQLRLSDLPIVYQDGASDKSARTDKQRADSLYQKATLRFSQGDVVRCLSLLDEVLRLDPDHSLARVLEQRLSSEISGLAEQADKATQPDALTAGITKLDTSSLPETGSPSSREDPTLISLLSDFLSSQLEFPSRDPSSGKQE